jgi:hypothetical protein
LRRAGRRRETFHPVALGLCTFADGGQSRRLAGACDAIQADNLLTREKDFVYRLTL